MTTAKTKYRPVEDLDVELTDTLVCSYAHHNTAEPCWGAVVFRGVAPTCVGHSKMVSVGYYFSQERVGKAQTTGGSLRLSHNRAATAMVVPEELNGVWQAPPKAKAVPEVSTLFFPDMVRPDVPKRPTNLHLTEVKLDTVEMDSFDRDEPINPNVKISVSDDTEIPEAWKDYL
jgi:hypothetical protein